MSGNNAKRLKRAAKKAEKARKRVERHAALAKNLGDQARKHAEKSNGAIKIEMRSGSARVTGHRRGRWSNLGYNPPSQSGDDMILGDLPDIHAKVRDMSLTNPLANAINQKKGLHTVGVGLDIKPSVNRAVLERRLGVSKDKADLWESETAQEFRLWSESQKCSWNHDADLGTMMRSFYDSKQRDGDAFALLTSSDKGVAPYTLAIQLLDSSKCENPDYIADGENKGKIFCAGIEKTLSGRRVAAHFARYHSDSRTRRVRGQKWDRKRFFGQDGRPRLLMMFDQEFVDQSRGLTLHARVIEILKQMGVLITEEVNAAVRAGLFVAMVSLDAELGEENTAVDTSKQKGSDELESQLYMLAPGETPHFPSPGRPNEALADFFEFIATLITSCVGIPYDIAMDKFGQSFTASQAAMTMFWTVVTNDRSGLVKAFCRPVYETWLDESVAIGRTMAPGYFDDPILRAAWAGIICHGSQKPLIRSDIETENALKEVHGGLNSLTSVRRTLYGRDSTAIDAEREQDGSNELAEAGQSAGPVPGGSGDSTI